MGSLEFPSRVDRRELQRSLHGAACGLQGGEEGTVNGHFYPAGP